jgi:hypothetical protein
MSGTNLLHEHRNFSRDQLLTVADLERFKEELLTEIQSLFKNLNQPKQWLRSKEVRKILNISPGTLQNFRVSGTLSYSRLGTVTYYKYEEIMERLQQNLINAHE